MKDNDLIKEKNFKDFFIIDLTPQKKYAYKIGKILREKGYKVGRDIINRDLESSLDFAFENRYKKAHWGVFEKSIVLHCTKYI